MPGWEDDKQRDDQDQITWQLIEDWLGQDEQSRTLIAQIVADPDADVAALTHRLHELYRQMRLPPTLATFVTGGHVDKLINIARVETLHVHQALLAPPIPSQLPPAIQDFTNREQVVSRVQRLIEGGQRSGASGATVITISGAAGVGKTAVALHVAHQLRPSFPDGQLYVDLRSPRTKQVSPYDVLAEFLRAFGIDSVGIPDTLNERARLYRSRLIDQRLLILLDNAATETQVRPLVPGGSSCAVLVTSRSALPGLEAAHHISLDVLEPDHALEFLGKLVGPERVEAENNAAVTIARSCGYLPLALRIAGAKLAGRNHWRLATLAKRLADERHRLSELAAGDLGVRSSFALSYRALHAEEQQTFRLLGLLKALDFPAWNIAVLLDREPAEAVELAESLVDSGLLEGVGEDPAGQLRYRFHDLVRVFARERLWDEESVTEQQTAFERLVGTYLLLAEQADGILHASHRAIPIGLDDLGWLIQQDPMGWFEAERASLVTAVQQAHEAKLWPFTWRLAQALSWFFELRSYWDDWHRTQQLALSAAQHAQDRKAQADALLHLSIIYREQGRPLQALDQLERCIAIYQELNDRQGIAKALHGIGYAAWDQGHVEESMDWFLQCLDTLGENGDRQVKAAALLHLGVGRWAQGRWDEALAWLEQSLEIYEALRDQRGQAHTLRNMAVVYWAQARWHEATSALDKALNLYRDLGDRRWEAYSLVTLGGILQGQGRWDKATECYQRCLPVFREIGYRRGELDVLQGLGSVHRGQHHWTEATACYQECLVAYEKELCDRRGVAYMLQFLGDVERNQNHVPKAIEYYKRSLLAFEDVGDQRAEAYSLLYLGDLERAEGETDAALSHYQRGFRLFETGSDRNGAAAAACCLGEMYRERFHWDEAEHYFCLSRSISRELGDREREVAALSGLGVTLASKGARAEAETAWRAALLICEEFDWPTAQLKSWLDSKT
jgi:tetratricopeptide (TPR) repeat protein